MGINKSSYINQKGKRNNAAAIEVYPWKLQKNEVLRLAMRNLQNHLLLKSLRSSLFRNFIYFLLILIVDAWSEFDTLYRHSICYLILE
jgi:protein-S-isoprenylcysteine O-methyltransferase Ste14